MIHKKIIYNMKVYPRYLSSEVIFVSRKLSHLQNKVGGRIQNTRGSGVFISFPVCGIRFTREDFGSNDQRTRKIGIFPPVWFHNNSWELFYFFNLCHVEITRDLLFVLLLLETELPYPLVAIVPSPKERTDYNTNPHYVPSYLTPLFCWLYRKRN